MHQFFKRHHLLKKLETLFTWTEDDVVVNYHNASFFVIQKAIDTFIIQ